MNKADDELRALLEAVEDEPTLLAFMRALSEDAYPWENTKTAASWKPPPHTVVIAPSGERLIPILGAGSLTCWTQARCMSDRQP